MKKAGFGYVVKRVIAVIAGLTAVLVLVLLIYTLRFTSKQIETDAVKGIEVSQSAVEHLSESIQFKTVSYEDSTEFQKQPFSEFCGFLKRAYPLTNKHLIRTIINDYSILYRWQGRDTGKSPYVLVAHYDVVPVEESSLTAWVYEPFSGVNADGYIWGRGAMDDKLGVIGIMEAVEHLLAEGYRPERTVYLAFGHDEEIGGAAGAGQIVEYLKRDNVKADYVLDEGLVITRNIVPGIQKDVALIGLSEKGYLSVQLSVNYEGGHASMPGRETTIDILARAVVNLKDNPPESKICEPVQRFIEYIGPEMPFVQKIFFANTWMFKGVIIGIYEQTRTGNSLVRTTTAPTVFNSGIKDNVLPTTASAVLNFRILPGESVEDVLRHVKTVITDERVRIDALPGGSNPSPVSSTKSNGFRTISKTVRQIFPAALVSASLVNGATDSRHYAAISGDVYRFSPQVLTSEDLSRIHGTNERISTGGFNDYVRFYIQLIRNSDQEVH